MSEYIEAFRKAWYNDQSHERIWYDRSTHAPIWRNVWSMFAKWVENQMCYTIPKNCDLRRIRVRTGYLNREPWLFISRDGAIQSAIYVKIVMCRKGIRVGVDFNENEAEQAGATNIYINAFRKCFSNPNDGWQIEGEKCSIYKLIGYKGDAPDEDYESDFNNLLQEAIKQYEIAIEEFHEIESKLRASSDNIGENEGDAEKQGDNTLAHNRIIFGAPGTGKSHETNLDANALLLGSRKEQCPLTDDDKKTKAARMERVTFHPEYSYFDFVGSYKPIMRNVPAIYVEGGISKTAKTEQGEKATERKIEYAFVPGPFTRILVKALKDKGHPYLLLIEEINRARVAAVFGDVFQLLDRTKGGESEYSICLSEDLKEYLGNQGLQLNELKLPPNLYIWATMNSADQGVYPLDTAFKRRWSFEYIGIDDKEGEVMGTTNGKEWNKLRNHINNLLQKAGVNEDKQLGPFFLHGKELENGDSFLAAFKSKVLMYLYEDAARHKPNKIFKTKGIRYSELCSAANSQAQQDYAHLSTLFEADPNPKQQTNEDDRPTEPDGPDPDMGA